MATLMLSQAVGFYTEFFRTWNRTLFHFGVYYQIGQFAIEGLPLYNTEITRIANTGSRYLYPPIIAVLYVPFTLLPVGPAGFVFNILSLGVFLGGLVYLIETLEPTAPKWVIGLAVICSTGFSPLTRSLYLGQMTPLMIGLVCIGVGLLERERTGDWQAVSGVVASLAAIIKMQYAPLGAFLLRGWNRLRNTLLAVSGLGLISLALFGVAEHQAFIEVLAAGKGWGKTVDPVNWTPGDFKPLYFMTNYRIHAKFLIITGVALLARYSRRIMTTRMDRYVVALGLVTVPLVSPTPNQLILLILVPACVVVASTELHQPNGAVWLPVASVGLAHIVRPSIQYLTSFNSNLLVLALQPAAWAVYLMFGHCILRIAQEIQVNRNKDSIL
ncbi:DUF2029 domain-containing protein [Salinirubellus salinus]|uniref:DUF2029 domain-containing protein n=1 Tax=Salinirubellus salinus TaxID=1364945 RepID=A0A9E7U9E3_9EURY|nr:glycosyltransferase family 87 protein [Salinirubellus salinus]UWM52744.1 DUF2029 domain-containing protein [Salinirubellus salinus]